MQSETLESSDLRVDTEIARAREEHHRAEAREGARRAERAEEVRRREAARVESDRGRVVDIYA